MRCVFILFVTLLCSAAAWDDGDFEVFDVVEEVNQNFYELMGVSQDASPQEIKSAFKKLTLKLHPDKNDSPDADVQFRNLVSVHNVLKDPGKREKYNDVLKNGLPNWRSAVYYYRHVRKMGLAEGSLILFVIITLGQYAVGWAAYAEKRFTAEQILNSRGKKHTKKSGFDTGLAEILEQLPRPSVRDTLPFQLPRLLWAAALAVPRAAVALRAHHAEQKILAAKLKKKEEEEAAAAEAAAVAAAAGKGARRRRTFVPPAREAGGAAPRGPSPAREAGAPPEPVVAGGLWTDDDLSELARLLRRWPTGTPERWALVARALRRPVPEVTLVAARLKAGAYRLPAPDEPAPPPPARKVKTRRAEEPAGAAAAWAQAQQAALEAALARHPKGGAGDRWDKIAASVPGKTKEECMQRCKYLSEMLRKQKQREEEDKREQEKESPEVTDEAEPLLST